MFFVYQISYMVSASLVYNYVYLCKVMNSPTYIILHSLEFHSLLSSGHPAVLDILQQISTGSFKLDKPISNQFDYIDQFKSQRL